MLTFDTSKEEYIVSYTSPISPENGIPLVRGDVTIEFTCLATCDGNPILSSAKLDLFRVDVQFDTESELRDTVCNDFGGPLKIRVTSDELGNKLGEITSRILSTTNYSNQSYPKADIGDNTSVGVQEIQPGSYLNFFSFRPKLKRVLLGKGNTLYAQTSNIKDIQLTDGEFFSRILKYSAARFILSGLLNGVFEDESLLRDNYSCFIAKLATSDEFSIYLPFFTSKECGYKDYFKYFKEGSVCIPCIL